MRMAKYRSKLLILFGFAVIALTAGLGCTGRTVDVTKEPQLPVEFELEKTSEQAEEHSENHSDTILSETYNPVEPPKTSQSDIMAEDVNAVQLGELFTLREGQTASFVEAGDVTLTLTGFTYSPCPEGARCIWSGLAVHYKLRVAGQVFQSDSSAPYSVNVIDSDYKSYAEFIVRRRD